MIILSWVAFAFARSFITLTIRAQIVTGPSSAKPTLVTTARRSITVACPMEWVGIFDQSTHALRSVVLTVYFPTLPEGVVNLQVLHFGHLGRVNQKFKQFRQDMWLRHLAWGSSLGRCQHLRSSHRMIRLTDHYDSSRSYCFVVKINSKTSAEK